MAWWIIVIITATCVLYVWLDQIVSWVTKVFRKLKRQNKGK